jgi:hypothetical protein
MRKIFQININKSWHLLVMGHLQIKTECLENFAKSPTLALYDPNSLATDVDLIFHFSPEIGRYIHGN